jgi:hypothetical protein
MGITNVGVGLQEVSMQPRCCGFLLLGLWGDERGHHLSRYTFPGTKQTVSCRFQFHLRDDEDTEKLTTKLNVNYTLGKGWIQEKMNGL